MIFNQTPEQFLFCFSKTSQQVKALVAGNSRYGIKRGANALLTMHLFVSFILVRTIQTFQRLERITGNQGQIIRVTVKLLQIKISKTTLKFNRTKEEYLKVTNYCCLFSNEKSLNLSCQNLDTKKTGLTFFLRVSSLQLADNAIFSHGYAEFTHHAFNR